MKMHIPRINKYVGMLLLALLLAGAAVWLTLSYLHQQKDQYQQQLQTELSKGKVQVVVPKEDLPAGTLADGSNMAIRMFPRDLLYPHTVTKEKWLQYAAHTLRRGVEAGKPLLESDFDQQALSSFADVLHNNHRAVTINVNTVNSIDGMVQPGDLVDIMLLQQGNAANSSLLPLMHRVRVLATGNKIASNDDNGSVSAQAQPGHALAESYSTMTLDLSPKQASQLMLAREIGSLKIALTSSKFATNAPGMPKENAANLLRQLEGHAQHRVRGIDHIDFIIGSTQGISQHGSYRAMVPVKNKPDAPVEATDAETLRQQASKTLTKLIKAEAASHTQNAR